MKESGEDQIDHILPKKLFVRDFIYPKPHVFKINLHCGYFPFPLLCPNLFPSVYCPFQIQSGYPSRFHFYWRISSGYKLTLPLQEYCGIEKSQWWTSVKILFDSLWNRVFSSVWNILCSVTRRRPITQTRYVRPQPELILEKLFYTT